MGVTLAVCAAVQQNLVQSGSAMAFNPQTEEKIIDIAEVMLELQKFVFPKPEKGQKVKLYHQKHGPDYDKGDTTAPNRMIEVMNKNVTALSKGIANYAQSNEQGFWRFKPDIAKKESSGSLRNDDGMFCIWTKPKEEYFYSSESGSESGSESDKQSVEEKTQENKKTTPPPDKQLVEEKTQENKKKTSPPDSSEKSIDHESNSESDDNDSDESYVVKKGASKKKTQTQPQTTPKKIETSESSKKRKPHETPDSTRASSRKRSRPERFGDKQTK
jgi:hypothetical protein